jgi:OOP family OmpA-OmpF porin
MSERRIAMVVGVLFCAAVTGCANMRDREWDGCAIAGGVIGGTVGGITGGVVTNNVENHPSNSERGGAIGGGIVGGAALGALLGHAICDPEKQAPPPPPPPPPAPPAARAPAPGTKLGTVGSAYFDFNRAVVKAGGGHDVLADVVRTMKDNPSLRVSVEGHTDSVGSDAYNQRLSERRAQAVKDYLVHQGIDAGRITTTGYGESKPVASNATEAGRAQNRRAEVIAR